MAAGEKCVFAAAVLDPIAVSWRARPRDCSCPKTRPAAFCSDREGKISLKTPGSLRLESIRRTRLGPAASFVRAVFALSSHLFVRCSRSVRQDVSAVLNSTPRTKERPVRLLLGSSIAVLRVPPMHVAMCAYMAGAMMAFSVSVRHPKLRRIAS